MRGLKTKILLSVQYFSKSESELVSDGSQSSFVFPLRETCRWRWIWSNGRLIVTGENWGTGRKTLYSVGGRWMNEYGAMVEWYWQGKTEVLGERHHTGSVVDEWVSMDHWWNDTGRGNWSAGRKTLYSVGGRWMSMEQWWNDTGRGKLKYWEINIIQRGW